jgi:hypothetical protein
MLVKPEEVGLSSGRLGRITDHLRRYIDAGKLAGTLTLVARRGKIADCEPQGHLEIERTRPVTPDSLFRIFMTQIMQMGLPAVPAPPRAVIESTSTSARPAANPIAALTSSTSRSW